MQGTASDIPLPGAAHSSSDTLPPPPAPLDTKRRPTRLPSFLPTSQHTQPTHATAASNQHRHTQGPTEHRQPFAFHLQSLPPLATLLPPPLPHCHLCYCHCHLCYCHCHLCACHCHLCVCSCSHCCCCCEGGGRLRPLVRRGEPYDDCRNDPAPPPPPPPPPGPGELRPPPPPVPVEAKAEGPGARRGDSGGGPTDCISEGERGLMAPPCRWWWDLAMREGERGPAPSPPTSYRPCVWGGGVIWWGAWRGAWRANANERGGGEGFHICVSGGGCGWWL